MLLHGAVVCFPCDCYMLQVYAGKLVLVFVVYMQDCVPCSCAMGCVRRGYTVGLGVPVLRKAVWPRVGLP